MAFTVTYDKNGAPSGTVPTDGNSYQTGDTVKVLLPKAGDLTKKNTVSNTVDTFARWNTKADGTGTPFGYAAAFTFPMGTSNVTLFAQWYTAAGLTDSGLGPGVTKHYAFSFESSLSAIEPARTNAVIAACESDYQLMSGWFGGSVKLTGLPISVFVANLGVGANTTSSITLKPSNGDSTLMRYLIVSEVTELFMAAQGKGWYAPDGSNEQSCGEGLSRFLAQQFLVLTGLGVSEPGFEISPRWLNSSLPAGTVGSTQIGEKLANLTASVDTATTLLQLDEFHTVPFEEAFIAQVDEEQMLVTNSDSNLKTYTVVRGYNDTAAVAHNVGIQVFLNYGFRADYVNVTLEYDHQIDPATGCAMLFLYYLSTQLGYSIQDIVTAAPGSKDAASCLRGVYRKLTGDTSDPFPYFKAILGNLFPPNQLSSIPGDNPDNPFPIANNIAAFEANTTNLWVAQNDQKLGMMVGTSPSIAAAPTGGWFATFQANTSNLWVMGSQDSVGDLKLGMMAGTSPSIAVTPSGAWFAAFQANTSNLWVMGSQNSVGDMKLGMMVGTSPSITATPDEGWFAAFQANTSNLWVMGSQNSVGDMKLGMMVGTSPSIAATPNGGWFAAFQANTTNLWVMGSQDSVGDMKLGMMKGTSPSIAVTPNGEWFVAFQANTGNLWVMGSKNSVGDMKLGMMAGTSPSIAATPNGGWVVAFQANTGNLWIMGSENSVGDMKLGMMKGTSPSITELRRN